MFLGIIRVLFIILNLLVCLHGIFVGVLAFLFGVYGILCVILPEKTFLKQYLQCSLWKKVRRLEKSPPPPVEAVETNIRYGADKWSNCTKTNFLDGNINNVCNTAVVLESDQTFTKNFTGLSITSDHVLTLSLATFA